MLVKCKMTSCFHLEFLPYNHFEQLRNCVQCSSLCIWSKYYAFLWH